MAITYFDVMQVADAHLIDVALVVEDLRALPAHTLPSNENELKQEPKTI